MTDISKPIHASVALAGDGRGDSPLLPPDSPLSMPVQSFESGTCVSGPFPTTPRGMALRRAWVLGGTAALTLAATAVFFQVLATGGVTILETLLLVLFVALFAWIAQSFVSACAGFLLSFSKRRPRLQLANDFGPLPQLRERTALLMPTYNEDPQRLMTGLQAIYESVAATGRLAHFDFFILSDTTKADIQAAELVAFRQLRERTGGHARLFYRRRADNRERKAGNISEWVRRFGAGYPYMLVLDADSLMTGEVVVRMADAIERHPDVGLIQTLPMIVNGNTLFARMQQFSGRVYGPVVARGIAWWHGAESNYWGHNAVIRTRAFAEQAGLPELTGMRPFGGHILSHDFVEAALMRRGGWALHMVPGLVGSYEEGPPTLTDMMIRDRRWCQGNLQHSAVLPAKGLHWVSRWHLVIGIGHYFTAPMWAMLMLVGIAVPLTQVDPNWDASGLVGFSPSSYWRAQNPHLILWVFAGSMTVLMAPKLMGFIAAMFDGPVRRGT
ncbi:MAG: glucans biosynthesis glucosyltransferase MdoH, partial [Pseudoxanthomonas sp.]